MIPLQTLKQKYLSRFGAKGDSVPPAFTLLACGTFSSCCGQVAAYPLALVRTKLQSQGMYNCTGTTMKKADLYIHQKKLQSQKINTDGQNLFTYDNTFTIKTRKKLNKLYKIFWCIP